MKTIVNSVKEFAAFYLDWIPLLATAGIVTVQMLIALFPVMLHILGIR